MSKAQLVITAVALEGRSKTEVARDYEVSRQWVHQLVTATRPTGCGVRTALTAPAHQHPRHQRRA
jgi:transposase